jgi:signal transduction histidine kinase/CheY-like chemotaxis protein
VKVEGLFERLPVAAVVVDPFGIVVAANVVAGRAGLPTVGAKVWAASAQLETWWTQLVDDQGATDVELETHAGKRIMRIAVAREDAEHVLVCFVDITQRVGRLAEQLAQKAGKERLESLGLVAGGVAHEFNNQLVSVVAEASLLREDEALSHDMREAIGRIDGAARRMTQLTRQLLAFAGRGRFVTALLDPDALVTDTKLRLARMVPPSVALEVRALAGPVAVEADRSLLRQVILDLVENAVDAVGAKGTIEVITRLAGGRWELEVHDDGVGMDDATRARMFDPFFSTKKDRRGLGLSAVLGIVRRLGGDIGVTSQVGFGTTVRVHLPIMPGIAPLRRRTTSEQLPMEKLTGLRILVADDEPTVRQTVQRALMRRQALPVVACDGAEAEELLRTHKFDVVLLDVMMPKKTGYQLVSIVRETQPDVPVILMSGYSEQAGGDPPDAFIEKPFSVSGLEGVIQAALRGEKPD